MMANIKHLRHLEYDPYKGRDALDPSNFGLPLKKFWYKQDVDKPQYIYGWNILFVLEFKGF